MLLQHSKLLVACGRKQLLSSSLCGLNVVKQNYSPRRMMISSNRGGWNQFHTNNFNFKLNSEEQQQHNNKQQQQQETTPPIIGGTGLKIQWWKWMLGAGIFYLVYEGANQILLPIIEREVTLHLSVEQEDEAYQWLMSYFAQHPYTQNCTHLSVLSSDNRAVSNMLGGLFGVFGSIFAPQNPSSQQGGADNQIMYTPVDGVRHFFYYKGKLTWIYIEKSMPKGEEKKSREKLTITILGRDKKILTDLVEESRSLFKEHKKDKTVIYSPSMDCYDWEELTRKPKRPLNSLILGGNILEDIVTDLKSFVDGSKFYYARGIPYRRGILLKGPPGTGKSSTVMAVAGELGLDIYVLNVSSNKLDDEKLARLLHKVPQQSIVLIEDVDSCESATERDVKSDSDQHISVSGLLNSIDGLGAQEGRIIFLTTNHPEKLNEALVRPGRIDRKFHIGFADKNQINKLFINFYQGTSGGGGDSIDLQQHSVEQLAETFTEKISGIEITPAKLQGYFMKYKSNPKKAFENVEELSKEREF